MFPQVLEPVLRAAKACGVQAVRNPFEPSGCLGAGTIAATPGLWIRAAEVALLRSYSRAFRRIVREEGMKTTQGAIGVIATGTLDQRLQTKMLERLSEGTWELVCHPGYADADLESAGTRLVASRQVELQALTSSETRDTLKKHEIQLIAYDNVEEI
jgi:predicted glycoside hydrolase/deacetylase ChbG (UPF0249 family)